MKWVDNYILGLIDMFETNDVYELFNYLKIKIIKLDKDNLSLQNNEAFYYRNYIGTEVVFIRNGLPLNYEKFILSHELGHAIMHLTVLTSAFNKDLINAGKLELQANYFAYKLCNVTIDEAQFLDMTIEQISNSLEIPYEPLKQLVNMY